MAEDEPEFNTEPQNPAHLRRGGLRFLRIPDLDNAHFAAKAQRQEDASKAKAHGSIVFQ